MYAADLAVIHHAGFGGFASEAAPGLLGELRKAGILNGLVLDLGCGSGIWLRELIRAGYEAWGVDPSAAMIRIARRVAPAAKLQASRLEEARLPRCSAVTAIGEVLCYRPERGKRSFSLGERLRKIHEVLHPGGLLIFDLLVTAREGPVAYRAWQAGDSWAVLVDVQENEAQRLLTREIQTFRRLGRSYRRGRERHRLDVAVRSEVEGKLRELGFRVRATRRYGPLELPPRHLAFVARKLGA